MVSVAVKTSPVKAAAGGFDTTVTVRSTGVGVPAICSCATNVPQSAVAVERTYSPYTHTLEGSLGSTAAPWKSPQRPEGSVWAPPPGRISVDGWSVPRASSTSRPVMRTPGNAVVDEALKTTCRLPAESGRSAG